MNKNKIPGSEVIKLFSCSTQLILKFILLINVKMPTIVGVLTFMSRINYQFLSFEPEFSTILSISAFISSVNFMLSSAELEKSFITSGPGERRSSFVQDNVYWWWVIAATTGQWQMTRYNVGEHVTRGSNEDKKHIKWFVR